MKIYAVNGSPRKNKNTATLLQAALDGAIDGALTAKSATVQTELIHLYDLEYKSCQSCFACKRIDGISYGKCALQDSLTPVLQELSAADGIIFGSPIYYGNITGKMRSFFERLLFPYTVYDLARSSLAPRRMPTAFIYTMNVTGEQMEEYKYKQNLQYIEFTTGNIFSTPGVLYAFNTYQFDDYTKYKADRFPEKEKAEYRERRFPKDCQEAFRLGLDMAEKAAETQ
jgi:multimeric flavodoxin WrbA